MKKKIKFYLNKLKGSLWFRPLLFCILSVIGALISHKADGTRLNDLVPVIAVESIESLLNTISASMLVIATFAVASMISAFTAASNTATPRSFKIVVTDDVSQYALSIFIGAFIFSIVATIALKNGYYDKAGRFVLFVFTLMLFAVVIVTFLRWVDRISRLGRLEHTIKQVETVAKKALQSYINAPYLNALPIMGEFEKGSAVFSRSTGYVQFIDIKGLQDLAEAHDVKIRLCCLVGKFVNENSELALINEPLPMQNTNIKDKIYEAIQIGHYRLFEDDPRFGLIALTEIASRALSPGINDPGTAIQIIGSHERLFFLWNAKRKDDKSLDVKYDRVEVNCIEMSDFFDDAFRPIARDGAGNIEVMLRLQKTFNALSLVNQSKIESVAKLYSKNTFLRAESHLENKQDIDLLKENILS
ncbi:DUF2254 domain-containing protein [Formosa sp. S-31]|uniref:DUF2254 domain-containing protein n=1 Tax=Formosa sp. S-31 TaxID=2790949 RepID=UPI003EB72331